ncbi:MAG: SDR family oxidoreductase [Sphingomonadales bacterium]|nr:SDR family oxidoreductase [Sphingomonadales bacterium]
MSDKYSRVILVTGASSGIGAAVCRRLAGPGIALAIQGRGGGEDSSKSAPMEALAAQLRESGAVVEPFYGDFGQDGYAASLIVQILSRFGRLDQIVSNAGFADRSLLGEVQRSVLDRSYRVMTGAFFDLTTAAMEALQASDCGRVVAISSFVAHVYAPGRLFPVTAAAKAAVEALAKSLAVQLGPCGVTVNCVAPGYTRKDAGAHRAIPEAKLMEMAELAATGRIAEPEDIAAAVAFLLSADARQITGQVLRVDGGLGIS